MNERFRVDEDVKDIDGLQQWEEPLKFGNACIMQTTSSPSGERPIQNDIIIFSSFSYHYARTNLFIGIASWGRVL